jgi:hypothetical protein
MLRRMNDSGLRKVAALAGFGFVVLSMVIAFVAPPWPPAGAGQEAIVAYFTQWRFPFLVGNYLAAVASIPGFAQVAALSALLRRHEGEGGWLWLAALGSCFVSHAVGVCALAEFQALAFIATGPSPAGSVTASEISNIGFGFFNVVLCGAQLFTGLAVRKTRIVPAWIGILGVAMAPLTFVASLGSIWETGPLSAGGPMTITAFSAFIFWTFLLSVWLLRKAPDAIAPQAQP